MDDLQFNYRPIVILSKRAIDDDNEVKTDNSKKFRLINSMETKIESRCVKKHRSVKFAVYTSISMDVDE